MFGQNIKIKEKIKFDMQRKVSAHKTSESWLNIPHSGGFIEYDVTKLFKFVRSLNKDPEYKDLKISINTVMLKVLALAIKESPLMNAHVEYSRKSNHGNITIFDDLNISIPVLMPDGENLTPTIKNVEKLSLKELAMEIEDLGRKLKNTNIHYLLFRAAMRDTMDMLKRGHVFKVLRRAWKNLIGKDKIKRPKKKELKKYLENVPEEDRITVNDLVSSTVLISNIGSVFRKLPMTITLLEIISPHTTVIGLGTADDKYVIKDGEPEIRKIMGITYYFDHRALDFSDTVGFLEKLYEIQENPEIILE